MELARFTNVHRDVAKTGFCVDCTPDYQALMLKQDRCSHPETEFHGEGTGVRGFIPATLPPDVRLLRLSPTCAWVSDYLANGPRLSQDILNDGWAAGHSREKTRAALKVLKATRYKLSIHGTWFYTMSKPVPKRNGGGNPGA